MSIVGALKARAYLGDSKQLEPVGIGGFSAMAIATETTELSATAPNFTLEDGSNATDQLINAPEKITLTGVIGETTIRLNPRDGLLDRLQNNAGKMGALIPAPVGAALSQVQAAKQTVSDLLGAAEAVEATVRDMINGNSSDPVALKFVDFIEQLWFSKTPIDKVETRRRLHTQMAIVNFSYTDDLSGLLQFSLTLQKVRTVTLAYADISKFFKKPSPATKAAAGTDEKGAQDAADGKQKSFLSSLVGGFS